LGQPDAEKTGHFLFSTGAALVTQNVVEDASHPRQCAADEHPQRIKCIEWKN